MTNKKDLPVKKFIILSLLAFLLFFIFIFIAIPVLFGKTGAKQTVDEKIYLNEQYGANDPLLTQTPNLQDIISGPIISDKESFLGNLDAPITITIYTDFTCGFCAQTLDAIKKVQYDFKSSIKIMHKDYPNKNKAFASYQAAIAGRCAKNQDKFWAMSEKLYDNFDGLSRDKYMEFAGELGLDADKFNKCLDNETKTPVIEIIDNNIYEADALGITGIPAVYVNNREMPADLTYEELRQAVERELE